jgi:hypothetical protein
MGNTDWGAGILKRSSYLPHFLKADAAESSLKVGSFPETEMPHLPSHGCLIRGGVTGLLSLDIHHLSPAASMTLFTVHHFDEPTGDTNASPTCKMNLLVKMPALLIK